MYPSRIHVLFFCLNLISYILKYYTQETFKMSIKEKRKKVEAYILKHVETIDPSGANTARYQKLFASMSDNKFNAYMKHLKDGTIQLYIQAPNMKNNILMDNLLKASDDLKLDIFQRIWMNDESTGEKYLTPHKYPVFQVPIRRQSQFLDKKISVPNSDKQTDALTGQVIGDDRSTGVSNPEIQALNSRGLQKTLYEFVKIRGGDPVAYGEFKRAMEEGGEVDLNTIDLDSVSRTAVTASILLKSIAIDNNIVEE